MLANRTTTAPIGPVFALAALLLAFVSPAVHAQSCPEPSDVAGDPNAQPLHVRKAAPGQLELSWGSVAVDRYAIHAGELTPLATEGRFTHSLQTLAPSETETIPAAPGNVYYLVHSLCDDEYSSAGHTSGGVERPVTGTSDIALGLQGGTAVFGVRATVTGSRIAVPKAGTLRPAGPYDLGDSVIARGLRIVTEGSPAEDELSMLAVFTLFSPDYTFDPPADSPMAAFVFEVNHLGVRPPGSGLLVSDCEVRNALNELVDDVECVVFPAP